MSGKLIHLTNQFWRCIVLGNMTELEELLDCNCSVLDSFDDAIGTSSGIFVTLEKLKELSQKIRSKGNPWETAIHTLKVMRNECQTRIFIQSKSLLVSSLGIAINWDKEKVTGLILVKNAHETEFFIDDTIRPPERGMERLSLSDSSANAPSSLPSAASSTEVPEEALQPPFLCPKPPLIPATVTVTVLSCSNLKSRLRRVIERAVDAYVIVIVNSQERRTEVVTDTNPWFNASNSFLFELPNAFKNSGPEHAVITFRVMDKLTFGDDMELSTAVLPLASLPPQVNNDTPSDITLPLQLKSKVGVFGGEYSQNVVDDEVPQLKVRVSKVDVHDWWVREELRLREERRERESKAKAHCKKHREAPRGDHDPSSDSAGSHHNPGAVRKGSWTSRLGLGGSRNSSEREKSETAGAEHRVSANGAISEEDIDLRPVMTLASKDEWVEDKHVVLCMGCLDNFTMRKRKHHCRSCGEVFCQNCSSQKVKLGRSMVRVCDRCVKTKRVSNAVLSIERDSLISVDRASDEYSAYGDHHGT